MAFKQFTKCVKPEDFTDLSPEAKLGKLIIVLGIAQLLAILTLAIVAAATPLSSKPAILASIILVGQIIAFLTWWLEGRLICLNEADRNCAIIGRVQRHGLSDAFKGGDDDYTMNITLAPGQEYLLEQNPKIINIGRGYTTRDGYTKSLHCEFEGDGIHKLREYLSVILAMLILAFYLPWPADFILAMLAILVGIIGGILHFRSPSHASDPGNPLDVNENLGSLSKGDLVVIKGEWIYDSLHEGWHEIHPVRHCEIIIERESIEVSNEELDWDDYIVAHPITGLPMTLEDPVNVELYRQQWCGIIKEGENAEENGSRDHPQNDWGIHPTVDGCTPPVVIL